MTEIKSLAIRILKDQQRQAPRNAERYIFFQEIPEGVAAGSVYGVGDGCVMIAIQPSYDLLQAIKKQPGFSAARIAKQQQCQCYYELWVNTVKTGQGCRIYNQYRRRNHGRYPPLPKYYETEYLHNEF